MILLLSKQSHNQQKRNIANGRLTNTPFLILPCIVFAREVNAHHPPINSEKYYGH